MESQVDQVNREIIEEVNRVNIVELIVYWALWIFDIEVGTT